MPAYMEAAAAVPFFAAPLALLAPAPCLTSHRGYLSLIAILATGLLLAGIAMPLAIVGYFMPAMILFCAGLTLWLTGFWLAGSQETKPKAAVASDADEDDDSGGGGPRKPTPPADDPSPDGLVVDWSGFDRERSGWTVKPARKRMPAPEFGPERKPEFV